jgi:rhodanese-related sulfurtransferase
MRKTIVQALGIVIISGVLGIGVNVFRADSIPLVENWNERVLNEQLTGGLPAVSLAQVLKAFNNNEALFVDARPQDFYRIGHIPGAINIPVDDFDLLFPELREKITAAVQVITYCEGASCEVSVELTEKLLMAGVDRVLIYTGGMQQWQAEGHPVEKGQ